VVALAGVGYWEVTFDLVELPDVATVTVEVRNELVLDALEDPDVFALVAGRWDFLYSEGEGIRVAWEQQSVSVPPVPVPVEQPIYVAWEEQAVVTPGRPKGATNTFHPYITAFNEQAYNNNAFFTGSGGFDYDDNEVIIVPAAAITERLRENTKSYVAPRRRV
jgi:hypothetical protein